ncbi:MAG: hypothetical protein ACOYK9_03425 [Chlamydiia bacterium]
MSISARDKFLDSLGYWEPFQPTVDSINSHDPIRKIYKTSKTSAVDSCKIYIEAASLCADNKRVRELLVHAESDADLADSVDVPDLLEKIGLKYCSIGDEGNTMRILRKIFLKSDQYNGNKLRDELKKLLIRLGEENWDSYSKSKPDDPKNEPLNFFWMGEVWENRS